MLKRRVESGAQSRGNRARIDDATGSRWRSAFALIGVALLSGAARPATGARPGIVRVRLETSAGPILLALDARRAPATTANFMKYVDDGRFDGTSFYRAARSTRVPGQGFVQGGIRQDARRILPSFPLETTRKTGIRHFDATVSMARADNPASAGGNFVITVGPAPQMDARQGFDGYAAFGHAISGTDTVRRILAMPSGGGSGVFKGQMILRPVRLIRAVRLDGKPQPTKEPRIWTWMPR